MGKAVAYLRVSTQQQHRSGLGIEAQRVAIARFAEGEGIRVIAEFVEAETGKGANSLDRRPQLAAALAAATFCQMCRPDVQARPAVTRCGVRIGVYAENLVRLDLVTEIVEKLNQGDQRGPRRPQAQRTVCRPGWRRARSLARRLWQVHRRRNREVGEGDQVRGHCASAPRRRRVRGRGCWSAPASPASPRIMTTARMPGWGGSRSIRKAASRSIAITSRWATESGRRSPTGWHRISAAWRTKSRSRAYTFDALGLVTSGDFPAEPLRTSRNAIPPWRNVPWPTGSRPRVCRQAAPRAGSALWRKRSRARSCRSPWS